MKKLLVFICALSLLIISEYYFLNEIFAQKRLPFLAVTLAGVLVCIFIFIRFFKKSVISS